MSQAGSIIVTSALTIVGGISIYVVGQVVMRFMIEPLYEQKRILGEIKFSITFYANGYANPGVGDASELRQISLETRRLAGEIDKTAFTIPSYRVLSLLRLAPSLARIERISRNLIFLSNMVVQHPPDHSAYERINNAMNEVRNDLG